MSATIRIGTQGWSYPDWVGVFYPPGAKQEDRLPFYAGVFDTVEIDATFYGPPKGTIARSWARHVPAGFKFSAKLPKEITHDRSLRDSGAALTEFAKALEPLGDKLGPVLVQLPAAFTRHADNVRELDRFLGAAPQALRLVVELRHESWFIPATYDLLRRHNAPQAWIEWRDLARVREITSDTLYIRWLGDREDIEVYDRVQIDRTASFEQWERDLRTALGQVREIYGYFNNHWAGHSPASANEMKRRLGLLVSDPRALWPQKELF